MERSREMKLDYLKEAINIGMGHSAGALSEMIDRKVLIGVTRSEVVPSEQFLRNFANASSGEYVGVYLHTEGDLSGGMVLMFEHSHALRLCDLLLKKEDGTTKTIDEKGRSAIKEIANILTGSFLSVLADMIGLSVYHRTPVITLDSAEAIVNQVCDSAFGNRLQRDCIASEFVETGSQITGSFAFIPAEVTIEKIVSGLDEFSKKRN